MAKYDMDFNLKKYKIKITYRYLLLSIPIIFILIQFGISISKPLWLDEVATINYTSVDSFKSFLFNFSKSGDLNPPLFYIIVYLLRNIFSDSIFLYRLIPAFFALFGLVILYKYLLKNYNFQIAVTSLLLISFSNFYSHYLLFEFRSYSLYFLLFILFSIKWLDIYFGRKDRNFKYFLLVIFATLMNYSHYFAIQYSLLMLFFLFIVVNQKRAFYAFAVTFLFSLPSIYLFFEQKKIFNGVVWQETPTLLSFIGLPLFYLGNSVLIITLILFLVCLPILKKINHIKKIYLFLMMLFLVPTLNFILSFLGLSVFVERYFIPTYVGLIILLSIIIGHLSFNQWHIKFIMITIVSLLIYKSFIFYSIVTTQKNQTDEIVRLINSLELKIIFESPHLFYPLNYYSSNEMLYLILDYDTARNKQSIKNALFDYYGNKQVALTQLKFNIIDKFEESSIQHDDFYVVDQNKWLFFENKIQKDFIYSQIHQQNIFGNEVYIYIVNGKPNR